MENDDLIYKELCNRDSEFADKIMYFIHWGSNSILVRLDDGTNYKVKMSNDGGLHYQQVSREDIKKKYSK